MPGAVVVIGKKVNKCNIKNKDNDYGENMQGKSKGGKKKKERILKLVFKMLFSKSSISVDMSVMTI